MVGRRPTGDRGETLIEVLVAVMIMGVGVVVLLGGLGTSIRMSALHRHQASATTYLRAYAEAVQAAVDRAPTAYVPCAGLGSYGGVYTTGDTDYTPRVLSVRYWNGSAFGDLCTVVTDSGVQQVVLSIENPEQPETMTIIIRKPCRSTVDFPAELPCL
jgi:prepilin-type N-terminal cleavage/methylation domain-containing protein